MAAAFRNMLFRFEGVLEVQADTERQGTAADLLAGE